MGHADGAYSLFTIGKAFIDVLNPMRISQCANGIEEIDPVFDDVGGCLVIVPLRNPSRILRITRISCQCCRSEADGTDIVRVRRPLAHSAKQPGPLPDEARQHRRAHDSR